ncbi:MAG TPA: POTRA domain-containing protein [Azospirillaceae bacterium]|nr:POTRA domain-containing protein [Azospirillaceae bacterium]
MTGLMQTAPALAQADFDSKRIEDRLQRPKAEAPQSTAILQAIDVTGMPAEADLVTFPLTAVRITGSAVYPQAELDALFQPLVGTTVSLAQVVKAARTIADKYDKDGYLLTRVILPVQDPGKEPLRIRVAEFTATRVMVRVDGQPVEPDQRLKSILDELARSRPLREADYLKAERAFDSLPDLDLVRTRAAGANDGDYDGVAEFRRRPPGQKRAIDAEIRPSLDPAAPPADADKTRFTLRRVTITGATVFDEAALAPLYRDLIGKEVTVLRLHELAKAISAKYDKAGYMLSAAALPAQTVIDGEARIAVTEMRAGSVRVEINGKPVPDDSLLATVANKIPKMGVLKQREVDHYLQLMTDMPGIVPQEAIPPEEPGGTGIIKAGRRPVEGSFGIDNRGDRTVGMDEYTASLTFNAPLGVEDRLTVEGGAAGGLDEAKMAAVKYDFPLSSEGTRMALGYTRTIADPGAYLNTYGIHNFGTTVKAEVSHPLIRQNNQTLRAFAQFDYANSDTYSDAGVVNPTDTRVRALRLGARYKSVDRALFGTKGTNTAKLTVSRGLDVLDASETDAADVSRRAARNDFRKIELAAERKQRLGGGFGLLLGADAQYGLDRLPSREMRKFGGTSFGRGYLDGILQGDSALFGKVEVQYDHEVGLDYLMGAQFFAFYDTGVVWVRNRAGDVDTRDSAVSIGTGARLMFTDALSGDVEVSRGMTKPEIDSENEPYKETRLFFSLNLAF